MTNTKNKRSKFGNFLKHSIGHPFTDRKEIMSLGLHTDWVRGISGSAPDGCDAIALNGGYKDDEDHGTKIIYTGVGGQKSKKQVRDQTVQENRALFISSDEGKPIRIYRGPNGDKNYSPNAGYEYGGLYRITGHTYVPSSDGPFVWRFNLEQLPAKLQGGPSEYVPGVTTPKPTPGVSNSGSTLLPTGNQNPGSRWIGGNRIIRNSSVTQWVKDQHNGTCQFCGLSLILRSGKYYAEGAHIQPLSGGHCGPDIAENVLCLCANCHVEFDFGLVYIDANKLKDSQTKLEIRPVRFVSSHKIDPVFLDYHRKHIAGV